MKYRVFATAFLFVLISCGTSKPIADRSEIVALSSKKVLKGHEKSRFNKQTLSADLKVNFKKSGQSQNLNVSLRLEKDKTIWLSASVFGFPVAKAIITPTKVSYYTKLTKTYYEGDFSKINKLLGADLNFTTLQNLLLGDALYKLNPKDYDAGVDQLAHLLTPKEKNGLAEILFWIHPINYKIEKQEVRTYDSDRFLAITYSNYTEVQETSIPGKLELLVKDEKQQVNLFISYKNIRLDEPLSFPYKIPGGYKNISKK